MLLYYGSNMVVEEPKIIKSEKGRDFGFAFYLTPIKEQAERMAKRKQNQFSSEKAFVSVFEWDGNKEGLNYINFSDPNEDWLDLIVKCRSNIKYTHEYDIVEGKIADDSVGETVGYVLEGIMRKEDAVERLKFQKINSQIAFCSEKSLKVLKLIKSYEVE